MCLKPTQTYSKLTTRYSSFMENKRFIGIDFGYRPKWWQKVLAFFYPPLRKKWGDYSAMVEWEKDAEGNYTLLSSKTFR